MSDILGGSSQYSANESMTGYDNSAKMASVPTMRNRLQIAVTQAERQLADAKRAYEIFDKNPDLEELINILQRARI